MAAIPSMFDAEPPKTLCLKEYARQVTSHEDMNFLQAKRRECVHGPPIGEVAWMGKVTELYETAGLCALSLPGLVSRGTVVAFKSTGYVRSLRCNTYLIRPHPPHWQ